MFRAANLLIFLLVASPAFAQPTFDLPPVPVGQELQWLQAVDQAEFAGKLQLTPGRRIVQLGGQAVAFVTTQTTSVRFEVSCNVAVIGSNAQAALKLEPTSVMLSSTPPVLVRFGEGPPLLMSTFRSGKAIDPEQPALEVSLAFGLTHDLLQGQGALKLRAFAEFSRVRLNLAQGAPFGAGPNPWIVSGPSHLELRDFSGPKAGWKARRASLRLALSRPAAGPGVSAGAVEVSLSGPACLHKGLLRFEPSKGGFLAAARLAVRNGATAISVANLRLAPIGVDVVGGSGGVAVYGDVEGTLSGVRIVSKTQQLALSGALRLALRGGGATLAGGELQLDPKTKTSIQGRGLTAALGIGNKTFTLRNLRAGVALGKQLHASLQGKLSFPRVNAGLNLRALGLVGQGGKLHLDSLQGRVSVPLATLQAAVHQALKQELAKRRGSLFGEITIPLLFKYRSGSLLATGFRLHPSKAVNEVAFGFQGVVHAARQRHFTKIRWRGFHTTIVSGWRGDGTKDLASGSLTGRLRIGVAPGSLTGLSAHVEVLGGVARAQPLLNGAKWIRLAHNFGGQRLTSRDLQVFKPGQTSGWPQFLKSAKVKRVTLRTSANTAHVDFHARLAR
jgi:hypothetical protein